MKTEIELEAPGPKRAKTMSASGGRRSEEVFGAVVGFYKTALQVAVKTGNHKGVKSLHLRQRITATLIQVAVIFFLWYKGKKAVVIVFFSKRNRIIKKAVKKTVSDFADRTPKIYEHFFYGAFDIAPQYLVVWYLFQTDAELETAKSSGYCDDLEKATISNLIDLGYPQEAFEITNMGTPNITFCGGTEEYQQNILHSLTYSKAMISFTTKEDIDNKANGDYHVYFQ